MEYKTSAYTCAFIPKTSALPVAEVYRAFKAQTIRLNKTQPEYIPKYFRKASKSIDEFVYVVMIGVLIDDNTVIVYKSGKQIMKYKITIPGSLFVSFRSPSCDLCATKEMPCDICLTDCRKCRAKGYGHHCKCAPKPDEKYDDTVIRSKFVISYMENANLMRVTKHPFAKL